MSHPHIKFTTLKEPRIGTQSTTLWTGREPTIGGEASVALLLTALKKWRTRPQAAEALTQVGQTAVPGLMSTLYDSNPGVRVTACRILAEIRDERSVGSLCGALWDEHELVRREAATALARIASLHSLDALIAALEDEDLWVRLEAAHALGQVGKQHGDAVQASFPHLLKLVSEDATVRRAAMLAFVDCGMSAVDFLINVLATANALQRELATQALSRIARTWPVEVTEHITQAIATSNTTTFIQHQRLLNQIQHQHI